MGDNDPDQIPVNLTPIPPGSSAPEQPGIPEPRPSIDLRGPDGELAPAWGWLDILAVIAVFGIGWLLSGVVLGIVMIVSRIKPENLMDARFLMPAQLVIYAIVFFTMYALVQARSRGRFWQEIRWNFPQRKWVLYVPAGIALAFAVAILQSRLPAPQSVPMMKYFSTPGSAYAMGMLAVLGAPIIEELFFRGFLYPVAARWFRMWPSVVLIGLFFGLVHAAQLGWAWGYVLLLSFVGMVLTGVRARARSVGASFVLHTAYNSTLFVAMWFQTDHFRHLDKAGFFIFGR